MKNISIIGLVVFIAVGFSSCLKKENYPIVPVITYKGFVVNSDNSATLQVNFTDGDGDIGSQSTTNAPTNFYVVILVDSSRKGIYVPILDGALNDPVMGDTVFLGYSVPYITPTGSDKELSGEIQVAITAGTWYLTQNPGAIPWNYEYQIWLIDRAGHKSSRIITSPAVSSPQQ